MDIFKEFATDENLEISGVEHQIGKAAFVTVARMENPAYTELMIKTLEENEHKIEDNPELDSLLTREILAKTILRGWKGLSYKGKLIEYSIDNAVMLLAHKDFRKKIIRISNEFNNFRVKVDEADLKK